ncbi:glycosyltransferase family 2 protein [Amphritea sp. 2_MG-2023]|uniref:glycosyltransferase family 2 protein n=1 Tax=Amphritea TaxID=515417 RepID=UPI001C07A9FF|nr:MULTISPECIES: glycosyltransferase family 2 protein [Amphritea]MBU2965626.1 glycosyltransferase family 2 protein [Amphritea atlantica]MDO6417182.1 glycosyltransferase family 2 protein [Amphritea sp. 2_MG-2023]
MRLVMTLLVKNEVDIIEKNIRFHHSQGVDAFCIMDNGSTDGTQDIIAKLQKEFEIFLEINLEKYNQGPWMTYLAKKSRQLFNADLIISNDADEFWVASTGNLKNHLSPSDSIVTVPRYNFLQSIDDMSSKVCFSKSLYKVVSPILYSKEQQESKAELALLLAKISPKVIVNPNGLLKIKGGNHRAKHLKFWGHRECNDIEVHHYPIRNYSQFENNIINRKKLLDSSSNVRMGFHYKRWVRLYESGLLEDEFKKMSFDQASMSFLIDLGVVELASESLYSKLQRI